MAAPSPRASLGQRTVCGRTEQLSAAGFEALRNQLLRLEKVGAIYRGVFLLLPQRSKHPREMVIMPKASTSNYAREGAGPRTHRASVQQDTHISLPDIYIYIYIYIYIHIYIYRVTLTLSPRTHRASVQQDAHIGISG